MVYYIQRSLEWLHSYVFGFDADIQVYGWSWRYWRNVYPLKNEGDFIHIFDGIFCFQRHYKL